MQIPKLVIGIPNCLQFALTHCAMVELKQSRQAGVDADARVERWENLGDARQASALWNFVRSKELSLTIVYKDGEQEEEGGSGSLQWYRHLLHPRQHINYRATPTRQHKSIK